VLYAFAFLKVHDYIKSYLGDSKQIQTFAQQFLERRSKLRNAAKQPKHEVVYATTFDNNFVR